MLRSKPGARRSGQSTHIEALEQRRLLSVSLASLNANGTASGNSASGAAENVPAIAPVLSANGRYVAFVSQASNLVPNDTNNSADVFVRDNQTSATTLVSVSTDHSTSGNGPSGFVGANSSGNIGISADGRFVVFTSSASNLIANDQNNAPDVFVRDLQNGTTTLVSANSAGTGSGSVLAGGGSFSPVISDDGRFVAFVSTATDLTPGISTNDGNQTDVYLRDLQNNSTLELSTPTQGAPGGGNASSPSISNDGRYVVFLSSDQLLPNVGSNNSQQVYIYDDQAGTLGLVSTDATGLAISSGNAVAPVISGDGTHVAFLSGAGNLVNGFFDNNGSGNNDLYVRDLTTNLTTLASASTIGGNAGADSGSFSPAISNDGKFVAYQSNATDLVSGLVDNNATSDVFLFDVAADSTSLVSVSTAGTVGNGTSGFLGQGVTQPPAISADGQHVVFVSQATDLTNGVTATQPLLYARDTQANTTTLLSAGPAATTAGAPIIPSGDVTAAAISRDGTTAAFVTTQALLPTDTNSAADVYTATVSSAAGPTTGDLSASIARSLPDIVVSGAKAKLAPVITITNNSPVSLSGPITIDLFLSTDQTLDAGDAAIKQFARGIQLGAGHSKTARLNFGKLATVATGNYFLLAQVTPGAQITDPNPANNVAASAQTVAVVAPFVDYSGAIEPIAASTIRGKKGKALLSLTNNGNIPVQHLIHIALSARPEGAMDASSDVPIKTFAVRPRITPNATRRLKLQYKLPATLNAGNYQLIAQIDSANQVLESNETNNTAISTGLFMAV